MYQHVIICDQQQLYALGSYSILREQSMFEVLYHTIGLKHRLVTGPPNIPKAY